MGLLKAIARVILAGFGIKVKKNKQKRKRVKIKAKGLNNRPIKKASGKTGAIGSARKRKQTREEVLNQKAVKISRPNGDKHQNSNANHKSPKKGLEVSQQKSSDLDESQIGHITHYFPKAGAAALMIEKGDIKVGDLVSIKTQAGFISIKVKSLQINRIPIDYGKKGEEVGLKISKPVSPGDLVYKRMKL